MASTYEPIATTTLGSAQSTITFSSIPSTYTDLVVVSYAQTTASSGSPSINMRFNGDTSAVYSMTQLYGDGTSAVSGRVTGQSFAYFANIPNTSASAWGSGIGSIMNYANTTTFKTVLSRSADATFYTIARVNLWRSTAAINSVTLYEGSSGNFNTGSIFTLYGIKAA
jgi:hypothetical protein